MKSNDMKNQNRMEIRAAMQAAVKAGDTEQFAEQLTKMMDLVAQEVREEYEQKLEEMRQSNDARVLAARGERCLTAEEKAYYTAFAEAAMTADPKQAVTNLEVTLPRTVINSVIQDISTTHPLLSKIEFTPSNGAVRMLVDKTGKQKAVWGKLTDKIIQELSAGVAEVQTILCKLSAFMFVNKPMLELGPEWLDTFVRKVLYEAIAVGLEEGVVDGTGKDMPIGMTRQVGDNVVVSGGVYPKKSKIKLNAINADTIGNLLAILAVDDNGKGREVSDVVFIVNYQDYFQKVMPATTIMAPDGTYRNDVMPYPMTVIKSCALVSGEAIIGIGERYAAFAGTDKQGKIEYSDQYHFVEDERAYIVKVYANGLPKDNNSFLLLDISELQPATYTVTQIEPAPSPSNVATLASLSMGAAKLTPVFAAETDTYTATTSNDSNTINAAPSDAAAEVKITVDDKPVENGASVTWKGGSNTVKVTVTAEDGTSTKTYTVTVTKE